MRRYGCFLIEDHVYETPHAGRGDRLEGASVDPTTRLR
jgi:hypothetical protein